MAPRPFWRGYLKLSLVTCPVTMAPATSESGKVRFHTLNARTGNRVVSRYVDAVTSKPVPDEEQARGYPRSEDEFVLLEDDGKHAARAVWRGCRLTGYRMSLWTHTKTPPAFKFCRFRTRAADGGSRMMRSSGSSRRAIATA